MESNKQLKQDFITRQFLKNKAYIEVLSELTNKPKLLLCSLTIRKQGVKELKLLNKELKSIKHPLKELLKTHIKNELYSIDCHNSFDNKKNTTFLNSDAIIRQIEERLSI